MMKMKENGIDENDWIGWRWKKTEYDEDDDTIGWRWKKIYYDENDDVMKTGEHLFWTKL